MEQINKLDNLEKFFQCNMKIKKSLASLAISEEIFYDDSYLFEYTDKIYKELLYMEEQFLIIATIMFDKSMIDLIKMKFAAFYKVLKDCGKNYMKIQKFYKECIADISEDLKNEVKETCVGYYHFNNIYTLVRKDVSINGFLHILHSYIMNNETIYGAINKVGEIKNDEGYSVVFRGKEDNEIANMLFKYFPKDLDVGDTNIVALKNKIMIMVRDRGHALTIELEEYPDGVIIRYFIPKLCNIEMINSLPGINKVSQNAQINSGARGEFFSKKENVVLDVYNFINLVPMDKDIPNLFEEYIPR